MYWYSGPESFESRFRLDQLFKLDVSADPELLGNRAVDVLIIQIFPGIDAISKDRWASDNAL